MVDLTNNNFDWIDSQSENKAVNAADVLERIFLNQKVKCHCTEVVDGIVNTIYKYHVDDYGVTERKVKALEKTLDLHLNNSNALITFPTNESGFYVSIPKAVRPILPLKELLTDPRFIEKSFEKTGTFSIPIGINEVNEPIFADLSAMPHCIIAGTTGSGKSVCLNSILASLLYQSIPNSIKFILIDPKKVELTQFEELTDYLYAPIITEVYNIYPVLSDIINKMNYRYNCLKQYKCKSIEEFNSKVGNSESKMNRLVVVIDELADLYAIAKSEIEPLLIRIAQLGRAAGIHLILATQYPSCKVVSTELKVNIPTKIAFSLGTKRQSLTILDQNGAENLLGKGDGLYCDGKTSNLIRFQCPFISTEEIASLINKIRSR